MFFPTLLLVIFLLVNLIVGFAKGSEIKTVSDYALGDRAWGGSALTATLLATRIGGGEFYGTTKRLISIGWVAIFGFLLCSIGLFLSGFLVTNQIARFNDCVTFGDFIDKLYGKAAKCFSGLVSGILCVSKFALQIQVLGLVFSDLLGLDFLRSIIFSTITIFLYTIIGGIRSVVATDTLHFAMTLCTLFALIYFTLIHVDFYNFPNLPSRLFSNELLTGAYCASRFSMLLFLTCNISVPAFQRLLMAKNREAGKKMYLYTGLGNIIVGIILLVVMFLAISVLGEKLAVKNPLNFIIKTFVPAKIIPFIGLGLVAVIFSTADSYLHSAGLCLSKDFLEPIMKREIKLVEVRIVTFLCGVLSMIIVLWFNDLLHTTSIMRLSSLRDPLIAVSVLYGFLGFKSSKKMFWLSVISGFLGSLVVSYIPSIKKFDILCGCFASLIAYFAVHCYENKGFKFVGNPILPYRVKNLKK